MQILRDIAFAIVVPLIVNILAWLGARNRHEFVQKGTMLLVFWSGLYLMAGALNLTAFTDYDISGWALVVGWMGCSIVGTITCLGTIEDQIVRQREQQSTAQEN